MRVILVCLILTIGWAAIRHLPHHVEAQPIPTHEISSISLAGRGLPAHLRDALSQQVGERFDAQDALRDRTALEAVLVARGYLAAKVSEAVVTYDARGAVYVTYTIDPGAEFRVRQVIVVGADAPDVGVITLAAGDVVDADRIANARLVLAERLRIRARAALVTANVHPDPARAVADVELAVAP